MKNLLHFTPGRMVIGGLFLVVGIRPLPMILKILAFESSITSIKV